MSTTTKAKPEEVAGLNEDYEAVLFGDDLDCLTKVGAEEGSSESPNASAEGLNQIVSSDEGEKSKAVTAGCGCEGQNACVPPCVSRVIDANGHARITIILGTVERLSKSGVVVSLIDSASENDVVDITIVPSVEGEAGTMRQRSILSAIDRCKGHVITRAGALTTVGDVAIWLSGDELKMSPIGSVFMRQPVSGFYGDTADFDQQRTYYIDSYKEFASYIVERGLFSQKEMDKMFENRGMLALYGEELRTRISNLKAIA